MFTLEQLAETLVNLQEKPVAITLLDTLGKHAGTFEQFDEVAKAFFKIKEYKSAIPYAEILLDSRFVSVAPPETEYAVKYNLINLYNHANYPERAMHYIEKLEAINPTDLEVRLEKAFALFLLNRKSDAEKILRDELENPSHDEKVKTKIRFNLGTYELLRDEFQSGLRKFLFEGRKLDYWKKPKLPKPQWDGSTDLAGKTIVIMAEAGIGDEFINVRFMNHLRNLGAKPVWYTSRTDMVSIFNRCNYPAMADVSTLPYDCWVHSMDLPVLLNLQYEDLWHGPYLTACPELSEHWKRKLNTHYPTGRTNIGIRWEGNPGYDQDLHRSLPLFSLYSSIKKAMQLNSNMNIFSLQRDTGLDTLSEYRYVHDMREYLYNFDNTMAIINNLDVVVTSCTSVAHAAASMGKRTIILTPISSYYTWCHSTEQSPWYGDNVTILRQVLPRNWAVPLKQLEDILSAEFNN